MAFCLWTWLNWEPVSEKTTHNFHCLLACGLYYHILFCWKSISCGCVTLTINGRMFVCMMRLFAVTVKNVSGWPPLVYSSTLPPSGQNPTLQPGLLTLPRGWGPSTVRPSSSGPQLVDKMWKQHPCKTLSARLYHLWLTGNVNSEMQVKHMRSRLEER